MPKKTIPVNGDDLIVFKTPAPGSALKARLNSSLRRSARRSEVCSLIDPLRKDIVFERGSASSKRRMRKGKNPFDCFEIEDLHRIPDDSNSPFYDKMK